MASPTKTVKSIRKAKRTKAGRGRKLEIARQHKEASERKLEAALGEKITLPTVR